MKIICVLLCTVHKSPIWCANLVSRQCKSSEVSTSFHPFFLSGHSRMSVPAPGSGSRKKRGFNGGAVVTKALFVKIAGRKEGNLTPSYPPAWPHPILPPTFGERSLEGDVSTSSLRHPVGAGSAGGAMVTNFSVQDDGVGWSAKRERARRREICRAEREEVDD
jgi:hypothetical protein